MYNNPDSSKGKETRTPLCNELDPCLISSSIMVSNLAELENLWDRDIRIAGATSPNNGWILTFSSLLDKEIQNWRMIVANGEKLEASKTILKREVNEWNMVGN